MTSTCAATSIVSIGDFPMEILQLIFGKCKGKDLLAISAVCRRWNQAVQKLIPQRVCLKLVSYKAKSVFVVKTAVRESNREYVHLKIYWTTTNENAPILEEILDGCQERFRVEKLLLRMSQRETLAYFFMNRQQWLHTLTELYVDIASERDHLAGCEVSLPNLKQLGFADQDHHISWNSGATLSLDVPELRELEVKHLYTTDWMGLFGSLEVKSCTKLEKLTIRELVRVDPESVEVFEPFLHNLKVLLLSECYSPSVILICDKCPNLTDLTVEIFPVLGEMTLQISPVLSQSLESLRLSYQTAGVLSGNGQVVFPKLRRLALFDAQLDGSTFLIAPQLTELSTNIRGLSSSGGQLNLPDSKQLRTMRTAIFDPHMATAMKPPSSNVTELYLWLFDELLETRYLLKYLELFPNLSRLTLNMRFLKVMDCLFVVNFAKLESFSAHQLVMDSIDLNKFAGLKSLVLSNCYIGWKPDGHQVLLTSLEYFRVERVTVYNLSGDQQFPIRINDRQAPIEMVSSEEKAKVFTSRNFKTNLNDDPRFEFTD